jgi:hypothetical protein
VRVAAVRAQPPERALETILAQVTPRTRLIALFARLLADRQRAPVEEIQDAPAADARRRRPDGRRDRVEAGRYDYLHRLGAEMACAARTRPAACTSASPSPCTSALPTYFSQDGYDESGTFTPSPAQPGSTAAGSRRRRWRGWRPPSALLPHWRRPPRDRDLRACLDAARQPLRGRTAPGQATLVSFVPGGRPRTRRARRLFDQGVVVRTCRAPPGCGSPAAGGRATRISMRLLASL